MKRDRNSKREQRTMLGGIVIEVCEHPHDKRMLYVQLAERVHGHIERCGLMLEKNERSDRIEMGDAIWWQGYTALHTPQKNRLHDKRTNRIEGSMRRTGSPKCGRDYDIKIVIVAKNVSNPWHAIWADEAMGGE